MKSKITRILSIVLVAAMVIGSFNVKAFAEEIDLEPETIEEDMFVEEEPEGEIQPEEVQPEEIQPEEIQTEENSIEEAQPEEVLTEETDDSLMSNEEHHNVRIEIKGDSFKITGFRISPTCDFSWNAEWQEVTEDNPAPMAFNEYSTRTYYEYRLEPISGRYIIDGITPKTEDLSFAQLSGGKGAVAIAQAYDLPEDFDSNYNTIKFEVSTAIHLYEDVLVSFDNTVDSEYTIPYYADNDYVWTEMPEELPSKKYFNETSYTEYLYFQVAPKEGYLINSISGTSPFVERVERRVTDPENVCIARVKKSRLDVDEKPEIKVNVTTLPKDKTVEYKVIQSFKNYKGIIYTITDSQNNKIEPFKKREDVEGRDDLVQDIFLLKKDDKYSLTAKPAKEYYKLGELDFGGTQVKPDKNGIVSVKDFKASEASQITINSIGYMRLCIKDDIFTFENSTFKVKSALINGVKVSPQKEKIDETSRFEYLIPVDPLTTFTITAVAAKSSDIVVHAYEAHDCENRRQSKNGIVTIDETMKGLDTTFEPEQSEIVYIGTCNSKSVPVLKKGYNTPISPTRKNGNEFYAPRNTALKICEENLNERESILLDETVTLIEKTNKKRQS